MTLDQALYHMGHKSKISIEEAASKMGVGINHLYRMLNPNDAGANLPARLLVPAMRAFNDYTPLRVILRDCGLIAFRPPRGDANSAQELHEYQHAYAKLLTALHEFIANPEYEKGQKVISALIEHMENTASWRYKVQKDLEELNRIDDSDFPEWKNEF